MGADNFVNSQVSGKRGARRARVLLAARLKTSFGDVEGRLRDLSRKGALLECAKVPPVGSEVIFSRGATTVPARVAWTGNGRVGLEFHCLIDEHEVLVQLGRGEPSNGNDRYRQPWPVKGFSAKERKLAAAWGVTVGLTVPEDED